MSKSLVLVVGVVLGGLLAIAAMALGGAGDDDAAQSAAPSEAVTVTSIVEIDVPAPQFEPAELVAHACRWVRQVDEEIALDIEAERDTLADDIDLGIPPPEPADQINGQRTVLLERAALVALSATFEDPDLWPIVQPIVELGASRSTIDDLEFLEVANLTTEARNELLRTAVVTCQSR